MITTPLTDGSFVTSPIYVGDSDAVVRAQSCGHLFKAAGDLEQSPPDEQQHWLLKEACSLCCAARVRYGPDKDLMERYRQGIVGQGERHAGTVPQEE